MMKKLLIFTTLFFVAIYAFPQTTSIATGNWENGSTWSAGVPASGTDATIVSPHVVTVTTSGAAGGTVTINSGGTLTINSGATLTTNGDVVVSGSLNQNGSLNAGDGVDDMFHINGGTFAVGNGSTSTIAGYYKQEYVDASNVGTISATSGATATVNVANAGAFNDNTNNIFHFGDDCVSALTGAFVNVNILEGNSGTADEIFIGVATGINPGNGTTTFGNGSSSVSAWSMINNSSFGNVKLDIGSGNTMSFSHTVDRTTNQVVFFGLDVTSGTFQIEPGKGLKVVNNNALVVGASGELVLAASASGTGELIFSDDNDDVSATIKRYIVGNQWHQISPSTTGATTASVFQNYNPNVWLMEWVEGTQTWEFIVDEELDDPLNVGQGYAVYGEQLARVDDFTVSYTGNMESADFAVSETLGDAEFALVGNPYSTAVRVVASGFGMQDNVGLLDQIWIYDGANTQYATSTGATGGTIPGGVVAQGQGFFVRSVGGWAGAAGFTIREDQRQFSNPSYFLKSSNGIIDWNDNHGIGTYVMLKVTDGSNNDAAFVNFGDNGTTAFENNYDGQKRFSDAGSPQLYLVEGENDLTIDYIKTLVEADERIVQMNFKADKNGEHTLAANLDSLANTKVTLEDMNTGTLHEFNAGDSYTFSASTEDDPDRFLLHFMYSVTGIEDPTDVANNSLQIYSAKDAVYISNNENNFSQSQITMYDLVGRQVYSNQIELGSLTRIPVDVNNTYLIVKVINGNEVVTQKVFVQ